MPQGLLKSTTSTWLYIVDKDKNYIGRPTFKEAAEDFLPKSERVANFGRLPRHTTAKVSVPLEFL